MFYGCCPIILLLYAQAKPVIARCDGYTYYTVCAHSLIHRPLQLFNAACRKASKSVQWSGMRGYTLTLCTFYIILFTGAHDWLFVCLSVCVLGQYTEVAERGDTLPTVHFQEDKGPSVYIVREVTPSN